MKIALFESYKLFIGRQPWFGFLWRLVGTWKEGWQRRNYDELYEE